MPQDPGRDHAGEPPRIDGIPVHVRIVQGGHIHARRQFMAGLGLEISQGEAGRHDGEPCRRKRFPPFTARRGPHRSRSPVRRQRAARRYRPASKRSPCRFEPFEDQLRQRAGGLRTTRPGGADPHVPGQGEGVPPREEGGGHVQGTGKHFLPVGGLEACQGLRVPSVTQSQLGQVGQEVSVVEDGVPVGMEVEVHHDEALSGNEELPGVKVAVDPGGSGPIDPPGEPDRGVEDTIEKVGHSGMHPAGPHEPLGEDLELVRHGMDPRRGDARSVKSPSRPCHLTDGLGSRRDRAMENPSLERGPRFPQLHPEAPLRHHSKGLRDRDSIRIRPVEPPRVQSLLGAVGTDVEPARTGLSDQVTEGAGPLEAIGKQCTPPALVAKKPGLEDQAPGILERGNVPAEATGRRDRLQGVVEPGHGGVPG